jgi:hypothetical protein
LAGYANVLSHLPERSLRCSIGGGNNPLNRKPAEKRKTGNATKLVRLGMADAALLEQLRAEMELPASEVWRRCLRAVARGDPFDRQTAQAIEEQLRKIGTNLNQIARRYNSGQVVRADDLASVLDEVVEILARATRSFRQMAETSREQFRARAEELA